MQQGVTVTKQIHFSMRNRGRREMRPGPASVPQRTEEGSVPRIARLMALAIRLDGLIRDGAVPDQAELARIGHITRARVTQIMNLALLAPDIQEALLFLPRTVRGQDLVREAHLRPIAAEPNWRIQRRLWAQVVAGPCFALEFHDNRHTRSPA
jgi:hypothetical protein